MASSYVPYAGQIVTRPDAIATGLKTYFDGKTCKKGHASLRRVVSYSCVACEAERLAARFAANRDRLLAYAQEHYRLNQAKVLARSRDWYAANTDRKRETTRIWASERRQELRERSRQHYEANRKGRLEQSSAWAKANRDKKRAHMATRRARVAGVGGKHSAADIRALFDLQGGRCASCRKPVRQGFEVDHIKPLALGGVNEPRNLQLLCVTCNRRKGDADPVDFARRNGLLL